jgi:hypothetical protein
MIGLTLQGNHLAFIALPTRLECDFKTLRTARVGDQRWAEAYKREPVKELPGGRCECVSSWPFPSHSLFALPRAFAVARCASSTMPSNLRFFPSGTVMISTWPRCASTRLGLVAPAPPRGKDIVRYTNRYLPLPPSRYRSLREPRLCRRGQIPLFMLLHQLKMSLPDFDRGASGVTRVLGGRPEFYSSSIRF